MWSIDQAAVPDAAPSNTTNEVVFDVTDIGGNPSLIDVVATIPASKAAGGKLFWRLSAGND